MLGSRHRLRGVAAAATLLLSAATVTACSGEDSRAQDTSAPSAPTPSGSSTPTPDGSPTPGTAPPARPKEPAARNTPRSREAFARFVVDSWSYALATNDAAAVTGLSPKGRLCQGCRELEVELAGREKQGWYVDFPGARTRKVRTTPAGAPRTFVARAVVDIPESRSYFDDGSFRNANAAHRGAAFEVQMRLDGKRWTLLAFRVA